MTGAAVVDKLYPMPIRGASKLRSIVTFTTYSCTVCPFCFGTLQVRFTVVGLRGIASTFNG